MSARMNPYDELKRKGRELEGKVVQPIARTAPKELPVTIDYCPSCEKDTEHDGRYCWECGKNREGRTLEQDMAVRPRREVLGMTVVRIPKRERPSPMPGIIDPATVRWSRERG